MELEWVEAKPSRNEKKPAIPFPFAVGVFLDANRLEWADTGNERVEPRWITVGLIDGIENGVAYTVRAGSIRLISARKAEKYERQDYWHR